MKRNVRQFSVTVRTTLSGNPVVERYEIMKSALKFESSRIRIADYFETSAEVEKKGATQFSSAVQRYRG